MERARSTTSSARCRGWFRGICRLFATSGGKPGRMSPTVNSVRPESAGVKGVKGEFMDAGADAGFADGWEGGVAKACLGAG